MRFYGLWRPAVAGLAFVLAACATGASVQRQPIDAGVGRSFPAPYEQTKEAVLTSLTQLKLTPVEREDRPEGHSILIGRPPHGFSWGEVGRIFIEKSAGKPTTVRVVYEKRIIVQGASSNFPRQLFARMDQALTSQGITEKSTDVTPNVTADR
jgi:hypothetical protein